jgi:hypothetical protein
MPFRLFLDGIKVLERGIPPKIDSTIWQNCRGITPEDVMGAFRFFQLIDADDRPTPVLRTLVNFPQRRGECMRSLLQNAYRDLMERDLMETTPRMLADAIEQYHPSESAKRAVPFFLQAARYASVPLPEMLLKLVRNTGPRHGRALDAPTVKKIQLRSGGFVTVTVDADVFSIQGEDRTFVFDLIDRIRKYEEGA